MTYRTAGRRSEYGGIRSILSRLTDRESVVEAGVGLVDVLVAITVLMVVMLPAAYLIDTTVQQTASARDQVTATELAEQELEALNNESLTQLESSLDQTVVQSRATVAGQLYKVSTYLTWQGVGTEPDLCSSGSPPQSISASAIVSWGTAPINSLAEQSVIDPPYTQPTFQLGSGLTSGKSYSSITASTAQTISAGSILTIGAGTSHDQTVTVSTSTTTTTIPVTTFTANATYSKNTSVALPDEGYLGVQINGVTGTAPTSVSAVSVTVTSVATGTSSTYTPDSNGCVYQDEVPGSYYVTLGSSTSPTFVDKYENAAPTTQTATSGPPNPYPEQQVSEGSATTWTATYNQGGTVNFAPSGGVPVAGGTPVSVGNTGIPSTNWTVVVGTGSSATSATLYPFASSYNVWYGDCLAEETASAATVTATAGGTSALSIPGLVDLTVEPVSNAAGTTPLANAAVTAKVSDPVTADNCPSDVLQIGTSSSAVPSPEAAVVEATRQDTTGVSTSSGNSVVQDPSIAATDVGKIVAGSGIPANSYVGTPLVANTSFTLWNKPVSGTAVPATGPSSILTLMSETYNVYVVGATNPAVITITSGGVVCTSGCIATQVGTFIPSGSPLKVLA